MSRPAAALAAAVLASAAALGLAGLGRPVGRLPGTSVRLLRRSAVPTGTVDDAAPGSS